LSTDLRRIAEAVDTPAYVFDAREVARALRAVGEARERAGGKVLYALKPLCFIDVLRWMAPHLDGFAASSLFEAKLARGVIGASGTVHITAPGLRPDEVEAIGRVCDHVAFNSLPQFRRFAGALAGRASLGLRVNPKLSLVDDERYDPCRPHSKLGVPLGQVARAFKQGKLDGLDGLHFHTNCDSDDFGGLVATVRRLDDRLGPLLERLKWVNLGGGYFFDDPRGFGILAEAVGLPRSKYSLEVFVEPGAALVRKAGSLIASVVDLFRSGGKTVAVLDTTVNHMPEVFEYRFEPDVLGDHAEGEHEYLLAGGSCLAGDVFGEYGFDEPLSVGSRVVFPDAGAYTTVKAHAFNGINLPAIYTIDPDGRLERRRRFTYREFLSRCGLELEGEADAAV
jgi:carboxynorspermidine decarboxylase